MSEKVTAEAFLCSNCKGKHWTEINADQCCTCGCGAKATTGVKARYDFMCPKCFRTEKLKASRAAIARVEREITNEKSRHETAMNILQRSLDNYRDEHAKIKEKADA